MKICLYLLFSILPLTTLAQTQIVGTIVDNYGEPLMGAIVQLKQRDTDKMIRFGKTDSKGVFSLEATADCYLEVSMLGFRKTRIEKPLAEKSLRIVIQEEAISLREVTIKANKVHEHGDTLTYNIATFADQNDRSIGDVLARLPGFEVNKQNGQIMYEGKPISRFYIEGVDMLGGKYGIATNTLPQSDVGSVQVMRNHQPIRVLEDFSYTDDAAVNIRIKEGAKSHWMTSFNGGIGDSHDSNLWSFEGFGLRLKSNFQTMVTYKTNNIGQNVSKETSNLFSPDDMEPLNSYIKLNSPTTSGLAEGRTLFNRSHAVTVNTMKRLDESSQVNVRIIYNNDRQTGQGERLTEYFLPSGTRSIDNRKNYLQKDNKLYGLVKYEKNSPICYLKNTLSGDFNWSRQWLNEMGVVNHYQFARKPEYDIKDNLYIIRKYGNSLLSFYSNNRIVSRPQSLTVDSLYQYTSQQQYSTNTYAMGGAKLGRLNLSLKAGINAVLHELESNALGLPDTLGVMAGNSRFTLARFYVEPKLSYKTGDINFEFAPITEYIYEKYCDDKAHSQISFSPDFSIRWYVTPNLRLSIGGNSSVLPLDASRFYRVLILQDYQYINRGWTGYRHNHTQSIRGSIAYNDALRAFHSLFSVSRSFTTLPYTVSRQFVGDYIIISGTEQETKSDLWQANLIASKGINLWNGVVNLRAFYVNNHSTMLQNDHLTEYTSQTLNVRTGIDFSFWKDMHLRYGVSFSDNQMKMKQLGTTSDLSNWKHDLSIIVPVHSLTFDLTGEYYRNSITDGQHKNFFLTDVRTSFKSRHADITLSLCNLLNLDTYSYAITSDLIRSISTNHIRGREIILSIFYKM